MPRAPIRRLFAYTPALWATLAVATLLSGCLFDSAAYRINKQIDSGEAVKALTKLDEKLTDTPDDPAFNLLAIKARLKVCLERACFSEGPMPQLLQPLPRLANHVTGPVTLKDELPPLTLQSVLQDAIKPYAAHSSQPAAVIALYANTPKTLQPQSAEALFQPALNRLHHGQTKEAATVLAALAGHKQAEIPATYTYMATLLGALLNHEDVTTNPSLIALRTSSQPRLPDSAAAILPWALMVKNTTDKNTPLDTLDNLRAHLNALNMPAMLDARAMTAITQELITTSRLPDAARQWQKTDKDDPKLVQLLLQQAALELNPNQPDLWASYLPTLVSHTLLTSPSIQAHAADFDVTAITSATAPKLANLIMPAVRKLSGYPVIAAPLLTFTGKLQLTNQQQVEYQKLSQELILKASAMGDVSTTLLLAQALPDAAQNNRHSVVPLLVGYIRQNLREGNFTAATNTANLLTQTLRMDVEFDPLILEEFNEEVTRRKIIDDLHAPTPEMLLKTPDEAKIDLGPLFAFMEEHFANQPKVISSQLTTLIAKAQGTYGQPSAMYRLGSYFPASTVSAEQQVQWLGAALEQALLNDKDLTATQLAETATRLAELHPGLNLAPIMETALKRAGGQLEDQRTLWQNATPRVREVLRAIRPEFTQLMTGIDAMAESRFNTAALAFATITQPTWREEAKPFLEQFHQRLIDISGIYIPLSGAADTKTAAIILEPQGLSQGGKLTLVSATFISRAGQTAEPEPETMRTNGMAVHRFTAPLPYNFDTTTLTLDPNILARTEQGGTFAATYGNLRSLKMQDGTSGTPLLTVTDARGTQTMYLRALLDTTSPLRPDGTYLIQTNLSQPNAPTAYILPKGSLITLTSKPNTSVPPAGADTKAASVYPLEGSLRHPASVQEIQFTGYFDPALLLSTFTFSYPLPSSGQPAAATVRCQTLAGPITCGMHNQNSARQAYVTHVTGMQTRESMAAAAALRDIANTEGADRLMTEAAKMPEPVTVTTISVTTPVSLSTLTSDTAVSGTLPVSATAPVSSTQAPTLLDDEEDLDEAMPVSRTVSVATDVPAAFINNSGSKTTSATTQINPQEDAEPGAFIDLTGRSKTVSATSPTAQ
ncbi:MAG: hypothetical protein DI628_07565 [Blastochloris viridis]|uniref:Uncharacterized protein n=1 Tax=Blastochloris viridis TaxID=1079 RepID=A0A6N4R522_BLAVI|nr:MAG: hypothetical protein DI628_07565 [Blastochloris viridis]